ncbi:MAG: PKD domain-containing protein, partial [Bacteroidetes bacterium]|nr:PKD domain-containing protein [Bacteroidota bacterium]
MKNTTHNFFKNAIMLCAFAFFMISATNVQAGFCKAKFTYSTSGLIVSFKDTSTASSTATYYWDFGDGNGSNSKSPTHTYSYSSTFTVWLKIIDSKNSCSDSISQTIVLQKCTKKASFKYYISGLKVVFTNTSTSGTRTRYNWAFGDGSTSNLKNPIHTYSKAGSYNPYLIIYDSLTGCSSIDTSHYYTLSKTTSNCKAGFSYTTPGLAVYFIDSSVTGGFTKKYLWKFGDGGTATSQDPTHTYSKVGTYKVTLHISDSTCNDSITKTIVVKACQAYYTYYAQDKKVYFTNKSSSVLYSYWTFGDGTTSTVNTPTHTYAKAGTYTVCLMISGLCYDTFCSTVTVSCQASFKTITNGKLATFQADTIGNSSHAYYGWLFGDITGWSPNITKNDSHTYAKNGSYRVCLFVYDSNGYGSCNANLCDSVKISSSTTCKAYFKDGAAGIYHWFAADSTGNSSNAKYTWSFGDGKSASGQNVYHPYAKNGTYTVCLTVNDSSSSGKCTSSYCDNTILVSHHCTARVSNMTRYGTFTYNFEADTILNSPYTKYIWNFGDGKSATGQNVWHVYAKDGMHKSTLTVIDNANACKDSITDSFLYYSTHFYVSGNIYLGSTSTTADYGYVYLIQYNPIDSSLKRVDSTAFAPSNNGTYYFSNVPKGKYLVKAFLAPKSAYHDDYLPTYHDSSLTWSGADSVNVDSSVAYVDVYLRAGSNGTGPGFIGGKVTQGANKKAGDPLDNIEVILMDANNRPY